MSLFHICLFKIFYKWKLIFCLEILFMMKTSQKVNNLFQILFIVGLACVIGLERTFRFFFQRHKAKASTAFFGGIFVVLLGFSFIGMILEMYGFILLFRYDSNYISFLPKEYWNLIFIFIVSSGFFPAAINFLRRVPVLGTVLNMPGISMVSHKSFVMCNYFCLNVSWLLYWFLTCFNPRDDTFMKWNELFYFIIYKACFMNQDFDQQNYTWVFIFS